jgi:3-dehydroquinate dehydratase-2
MDLTVMARILLLNGPNLNLLGTRQPEVYGSTTLKDIEARATALATSLGHELKCLQSNAEHVLVDEIHTVKATQTKFVIINAGAFTHTSVAIRDALLSVEVPFIEVHISNIAAREPFRHLSYLADVAVGSIVGLGPIGYELAIRAAAARLQPTA